MEELKIDEELNAKFDWNAQSLFSTPLGMEVQRVATEMLLDKHEKTSEYAKYIKAVNDVLFDLSQGFWDIDTTIQLIAFTHPRIKSFKMTKVDRGNYLKYMLENYFFRLPKLKDVTLNLLNMVYRMGLTQSPGLEKRVRKHPEVQSQSLALYLDYFDEALKKIKPLRDRIAHRGDLQDSRLEMLSSYRFSPYDEKLYHEDLKNTISYTYIFEKNQAAIKQAVMILLMQLKDDFDKISGALKDPI